LPPARCPAGRVESSKERAAGEDPRASEDPQEEHNQGRIVLLGGLRRRGGGDVGLSGQHHCWQGCRAGEGSAAEGLGAPKGFRGTPNRPHSLLVEGLGGPKGFGITDSYEDVNIRMIFAPSLLVHDKSKFEKNTQWHHKTSTWTEQKHSSKHNTATATATTTTTKNTKTQ
jgi:hypothetical protein